VGEITHHRFARTGGLGVDDSSTSRPIHGAAVGFAQVSLLASGCDLTNLPTT
jgi:hypothetical protein